MAEFTLIEALGEWLNWVPDGATNLQLLTGTDDEKQILWGIPTHPEPPMRLGFLPSFPPPDTLDTGEEFVVGRLSFFNNLFPLGGDLVEEVELSLSLRFEGSELEFRFPILLEILLGPADDFVRLINGIDYELTDDTGRVTIRVAGIRGNAAPEPGIALLGPPGFTSVGWLTIAVLRLDLSDPTTTTTTTPDPATTPDPGTIVFHPRGCDVPPIFPIEDLPILEDCSLPDELTPITDCPDIDILLPVLAAAGTIGPAGEVGPVGPVGPTGPAGQDGSDGSDGSDGDDGCTPIVTVSYQIVYTNYCDGPTTAVSTINYPPCYVHIHFIFYVCQAKSECCWYVCCDGQWVAMGGQAEHCRNLGDSGATEDPDDLPPIIPPGDPCTTAGQALLLCYCDDASSSTTPNPCLESDCECCPDMPEVISVVIQDESGFCPCVSECGPTATWDGTCWTAVNPDPSCNEVSVQLCCSGGVPTIKVNCEGGSTSATAACMTDPESAVCTFFADFDASELAFGNCCDLPTSGGESSTVIPSGRVRVIFTAVPDCDTTTTPAP